MQELRCGQQPVFAEERPELVQRRHERDEIERRDPPLEDLAREPEVDGREPIHRLILAAVRGPGDGLARARTTG
jgi:hypothetical protein